MRRRLGAALIVALLASACATVPAAAAPPPYWYADNATANEEDGQITFVFHKSGNNGKPSKLRLTTRNGTAIAGQDFTGSTFDVTVPASQMVVTRVVPLIDDSYAEPPENLSMVVQPVQNARLMDDGTGFGAIADADTVTTIRDSSLFQNGADHGGAIYNTANRLSPALMTGLPAIGKWLSVVAPL